MNTPVLIYAPFKSNRLLYVLDWVFKIRIGVNYTLTNKEEAIAECSIVYGKLLSHNVFTIPSCGLLHETSIARHNIPTGEWNNIPTLYATEDKTYSVPFDIFSAIFFLLSRYEEYFDFTPDKHNRYPATESILYKNNWLERPLIDEWITQLRTKLESTCNISSPAPKPFTYIPTYDIDIAWSYKNNGTLRNIGGLARDVLSARFAEVGKRIQTLTVGNDPYDSFEFLQGLHKQYKFNPIYFILSTLNTGKFDKNISPLHSDMQTIIKSFAAEGTVGIHPSYHMDTKPDLLDEEKSTLEKIISNTITQSRQHFIRLRFPETYCQLISSGIRTDYSMGYGANLGFRAGTGMPFKWFNIEKDEETALTIYPFCFMDSTAHYEEELTAEAAFDKLEQMKTLLQQNNSMLITVFHNFSLGTATEWKGWAIHYSEFLKEMAQ